MKRALALLIALILAMPTFAFAEDNAMTYEDCAAFADAAAEHDPMSEDIDLPAEEADELPLAGEDPEPQGADPRPEDDGAPEPFDQSAELDGVRFTLTAVAGALPADAALRVGAVDDEALAQTAARNAEAALGGAGPFAHHLYRIEVLDAAGDPIPPDFLAILPLVSVRGLGTVGPVRVAVYDAGLDGSYEIEATAAEAVEFDFVDSAVYDIVELPTEADGDATQAEGDTPGDAAQPPEQDAPGNPDDAAQPTEDGDPKDDPNASAAEHDPADEQQGNADDDADEAAEPADDGDTKDDPNPSVGTPYMASETPAQDNPADDEPADDEPTDTQKPSPLGVGAPGEQSGGLFSATTGRQAPGTVAQPKAEADEVPGDAAQSGDAADDAGNTVEESSAAPTTGEAQSAAEGDLISQRETLTERASQPDLAEDSPQESFPGAAVSPEGKPFGDEPADDASTDDAPANDSASSATDDAESASDADNVTTPADAMYGVPTAEPESINEKQGNADDDADEAGQPADDGDPKDDPNPSVGTPYIASETPAQDNPADDEPADDPTQTINESVNTPGDPADATNASATPARDNPTDDAAANAPVSTATDDAESASDADAATSPSDPAKTPAATIYGVPAAEPESPDEDQGGADDDADIPSDEEASTEGLAPAAGAVAVADPFCQTRNVDGVAVTVEAAAGVFPAGAMLEVRRMRAGMALQAAEAVDEVRDEDVNVAASYTFDIRVIDPATDEELQPAEGQSVSVSFALAEVADENLTTNVYHVTEDEATGALVAESLDVSTQTTPATGEAATATVETDGFSLYTVEFTYESLQYVLQGGASAPLAEITTAVGLQGEPTPVSVSDESLFCAAYEDGAWVIRSLQPFQTEEWMQVEIGGTTFTITVTDDTDPVTYVDENGNTQTRNDVIFVSAGDTSWSNGWYAVTENATLDSRVTVTGNVNLILCDGKTLTVLKGITVPKDDSLKIWAQSGGTGTLYAGTEDGTRTNCDYGNAAIGGAGWEDSGTIAINGGVVYAVGGENSAGIGSCGWGKGSAISICGGTVNAISGGDAAAIGAGASGSMESILISGRSTVVNATALTGIFNQYQFGAGIGSGAGGSVGTIRITGGTVTAKGCKGAPGIGAGGDNMKTCTVDLIEITGENTLVTSLSSSSGGQDAPGIGGGFRCNVGAVTIGGSATVKIAAGHLQEDSQTGAIGTGGYGTFGTLTLYDLARVSAGKDEDNAQDILAVPDGRVEACRTNAYAVISPCGHSGAVASTYITTTTHNIYGCQYCKVKQNEQPHTFTGTGNTKVCDDCGAVQVTYVNADGSAAADSPAVCLQVAGDMSDTSDLGGWYAVAKDTTIDSRVTVTGDVNLILCDGATLTAKQGITVEGDNKLTVWAQSTGDDMGRLCAGTTNGSDATCKGACAGIGSESAGAGAIVINGGRIVARGGDERGAGIGGNKGYSCTTITINGGNVTATGAKYAAGIGNGPDNAAPAGKVTITGGTVVATGNLGAGIGGGYAGEACDVEITGGQSIKASGGQYAAGIGGGYWRDGGTITIGGGQRIEATGGENAAGIGGGGRKDNDSTYGNGGTITITGGTVIATGGTRGAGIGGGHMGNCGSVTIGDTANVTATSARYGAGIGNGADTPAPGGKVTIEGGKVTTTGGVENSADYGGGAGIGSGTNGYGCEVEITGGEVTANGALLAAGIGGAFNHNAESISIQGTASVTANGGEKAAAIGGGSNGNCGTITIQGTASVTANGGEKAAAIGGGLKGNCGTITIDGDAVVKAYGKQYGSGIGNGHKLETAGGKVTINGGTVEAAGDQDAGGAGIGGGWEGKSCDVEINGGKVTATGGEASAGIGGGSAGDIDGRIDFGGHCQTIVINGGDVTANGGKNAAGIGNGHYCYAEGGTVTINGGKVTATGGRMDRNNGSTPGIGGGRMGYTVKVLITGGEIVATGGTTEAGGVCPGIGQTAESNNNNSNVYTSDVVTLTWADAQAGGTPTLPRITSNDYGGTVKLEKGFKDTGSEALFAPGTVSDNGTLANTTLVPEECYSVIIDDAIANGGVTADAAVAAKGNTVALTVAPDTGYRLATLTVTDAGGSTVGTSGNGNTRTFEMPGSSATVTATFEKIPAVAPTIATQPQSATLTYGYASGGALTVAVNDIDSHELSYQWHDSDGAEITGATNATFDIPTGLAAGEYGYYCVVTAARTDNDLFATAQSDTATVTVKPQPVTLTANSDEMDYDGKPHSVTGFACSVDGLSFSGVSASGSGTDAGEYGVAFTGAAAGTTRDDTGNYVVGELVPGKLTVRKILATVTITGSTNTAPYDGKEHAVSGYTAKASTDLYDVTKDFAFSGTDSAKQTNVGKANMGLTASQFANTNANFSTVTFNVTDGWQEITPIPATVTITGNTNTAPYDGKEHSVSGYTAKADTNLYDVAKDFTFSGKATAFQTNAGKASMGLTAAQFANTNANFSAVTFNVTDGWQEITAIPATVTITGNTNTAPYDGKEHSVSGYTAKADTNLYDVAKDFTFSGKATASQTNAGKAGMGLTASQFANTNANFSAVTFNVTDGWQQISPAAITIAAADLSGRYGETIRELVSQVSGAYVEGDDLGIALSTTATAASDVGIYPITVGWNSNPNYAATLTDGTYTITKADLAVTATGYSGVYDGAAHGISVTAGGEGAAVYYGAEPLTAENCRTAGSTTPITRTDAGTTTVYYCVVGGNYEVVSGSRQIEIQPKAATVAAKDAAKTYGEADPALTATVEGLVPGEPESLIRYSVSRAAGEDAGVYAVTPAGEAVQGNYAVGYSGASLTIAAKPVDEAHRNIAVTVTLVDAAYDGKAKQPVITVKDGDTVVPAAEYTVAFENNTNAGTAAVMIADAPGGNYVVSGGASFTIEKAKLTIAAQAAGKTEGEADPALTYTATGLIGSDGLTGALSREAGEAAGAYAITQGTLSAGDNYAIAFTGATFTIAPKPDYIVLPKIAPVGKTALKLAWDRDGEADGYDVFYKYCDGKGDYPLYKSIVGNEECSCKITGLKKGKVYKAYVLAWRMVDGEKRYIGLAAPTVHAIVGGYNKNWTNAKKVTPNRTALTMLSGSTSALSAKVTGVKAGRKVLRHVNLIRWYSSDTSVATVDADGRVTAVGTGACTIWAVANNGVRAGVKLTVVEKPTGVAFEGKSYGVKKGKALKLKAKLTPASETEGLTWASSNPKVAKVDGNGVVRGVKKGKATITVTAADGSTAKVKVKVK